MQVEDETKDLLENFCLIFIVWLQENIQAINNIWQAYFKFQGCHVVGSLTKGFVFFDSIAETMNVPPDHTFGTCLLPEDYGKYTDVLL